MAFQVLRIEVDATGIRVEEPDGRFYIETEERPDPLNIELLTLMEQAISRGDFTDESALRAFGSLLYRTLFIGRVQTSFEIARRTVPAKDFLHIRLVFRDAIGHKLGGLSWEYLHYPRSEFDTQYFFVRDRNIIVTRLFPGYREVPENLLPRGKTVNIWIIVSAPLKYKPVLADKTIEHVTKLADAVNETLPDRVNVRVFRNPTSASLTEPETLSSDTPDPDEEELPHIVHFIGHGKFDRTPSGLGGRVGLKQDERIKWCTDSEFVRLIQKIGRTPGLVILQQCEAGKTDMTDGFSGVAIKVGSEVTPAVIAMQHPILNMDAIAFSKHFYEELFESGDVLQALHAGRSGLTDAVGDRPDWRAFGTPVLHLYSRDAKIFSFKKRSVSSTHSNRSTSSSAKPKQQLAPTSDNGSAPAANRPVGDALSGAHEEVSPTIESARLSASSGEATIVNAASNLATLSAKPVDALHQPVRGPDEKLMAYLGARGKRP